MNGWFLQTFGVGAGSAVGELIWGAYTGLSKTTQKPLNLSTAFELARPLPPYGVIFVCCVIVKSITYTTSSGSWVVLALILRNGL